MSARHSLFCGASEVDMQRIKYNEAKIAVYGILTFHQSIRSVSFNIPKECSERFWPILLNGQQSRA